AMQETRRGVLQDVEGLSQEMLDWRGEGGLENSIGALLYHVAAVEASWLYEDLLLEDVPDFLAELFPHEPDGERILPQVPGEPLQAHLARLKVTREHFMEQLREMSLDDWKTTRQPPGMDYIVTPAWAV